MCGIAGFYDPRVTSEQATGIITGMLDSMKYRGPDYTGIFMDLPVALGHNRLSIIDLTPDAHHPFRYGSLQIILNGEIYNYIEIREELEALGMHFSTRSDTEVAVAAYQAWGEACVERFIGMWAFVIWDPERRRLFCSRDRFGIKPFNYIVSGDRFYFASEYKALKKCPLFTGELNEQQIARGLNLGWLSYQDETYYQKIKSLPASSNLVFDGKDITVHRYWDIDLTQKITLPEHEKTERFLELFSDSVKLQMRSDVKLGTCLSGGLDSSSILSVVGSLFSGQPVDAYTIFYDGIQEVDERPWAAKVPESYPNVQWFTFSPSPDQLLEAYMTTQDHVEVPLTGSSPVSQYFVMQLAASRGTKVLLDGQGADEYLGGYMHAFDRLIWHKVSRLQCVSLARQLQWHRNRHKLPVKEVLYMFAKGMLMAAVDEQSYFSMAYRRMLSQVFHPSLSHPGIDLRGRPYHHKFDNYLYHQVFTATLPTLLHYEDRNSMAFSIESRVPFLDHRLVEFCFQLSIEDKIFTGETKRILRNSMKGILPEEIRARQDKKGFVTPGENKWLRGPLKHLLDIDFSAYPFIDSAKAHHAIKAYQAGKGSPILTWRLMTLYHWLKGQ
ncbi:MAG TPA: asparagine synthase (glutamine-hydrolyzing) [Bacteroidales bacterium]|nr:asparagine synthase (glutamine-hydrolyzing) [Bacteroidales bacterium]HRZ49776.1 asparagine synthase (glutamine-hydrolyzing) [Bacteroidales bacterium]